MFFDGKRPKTAQNRIISRRFWPYYFVLLVVCTVFTGNALTQKDTVGPVHFSVYAPDWTWQKRDINILVILENAATQEVPVMIELMLPEGKEDHFQVAGRGEDTRPLPLEVVVPAQTTVRQAFPTITALAGVPRQTYDFEVRVAVGDREARVGYPMTTIRGAVVSPGKWALYLPAGLALAWCIVFAVVMRRLSRPGAWRVASPPIAEPAQREPWIDQ